MPGYNLDDSALFTDTTGGLGDAARQMQSEVEDSSSSAYDDPGGVVGGDLDSPATGSGDSDVDGGDDAPVAGIGDLDGQDDSDNEAQSLDSEDTQDEDDEPVTGKNVPLAALKAERDKRKALEDRLSESNAKIDLLWKSVQEFQQPRQPAEPEAPKEPEFPDASEDPIGHLAAKNEWLESQIKALQGAKTDFEAQQSQQSEQVRINQAVAFSEQKFRGEHPDYDAALQHLREVQLGQLRAWGEVADLSDLQIIQQQQQMEAQAASEVVRRGGDPAKYAYDLAKTVGYKPQEGEKPKTNGKDSAKVAEVQNRAPRAASLGAGGDEADSSEDSPSRMGMPEFQAALGEAFTGWKKARGRGRR